MLHSHSLLLTCHCYTELSSDPTIRSHLAALYDTLLQQNLLRIVEPYSVVEIDYVAKQVGQGRQDVEAKCALNLL
jgi:26S proteasome regulatory subunit N6